MHDFENPKNVTEAEVISCASGSVFWVDEPQEVGRWMAVVGTPGMVLLRRQGFGKTGFSGRCDETRQLLGDVLRENNKATIEYAGNLLEEEPAEIIKRQPLSGLQKGEDELFLALLLCIRDGMIFVRDERRVNAERLNALQNLYSIKRQAHNELQSEVSALRARITELERQQR